MTDPWPASAWESLSDHWRVASTGRRRAGVLEYAVDPGDRWAVARRLRPAAGERQVAVVAPLAVSRPEVHFTLPSPHGVAVDRDEIPLLPASVHDRLADLDAFGVVRVDGGTGVVEHVVPVEAVLPVERLLEQTAAVIAVATAVEDLASPGATEDADQG